MLNEYFEDHDKYGTVEKKHSQYGRQKGTKEHCWFSNKTAASQKEHNKVNELRLKLYTRPESVLDVHIYIDSCSIGWHIQLDLSLSCRVHIYCWHIL